MNDMLVAAGIDSQLEVATDNNCIDRFVKQHNPTHVIIEALWVVPTKFDILTKLHPHVKWIIRLHSEMPFIASEGIAMDWIADYVSFPQISIGVNAPRMLREVRAYLRVKQGWDKTTTDKRVFYQPNYYPTNFKRKKFKNVSGYIDISCFGAVRPLKNHLLQAVAALMFAERKGLKLRFHINTGRLEMKGDPVLNNLRSMFEQLAGTGHQLICHEWMSHDKFVDLCSQMDLALQVSISETFNIVAADLISQGVPVVGSKEIPWLSSLFAPEPQDSVGIADSLADAYRMPWLNVWLNQINLRYYSWRTRRIWLKYFKGEYNAQG
jgi:hypothetical protein